MTDPESVAPAQPQASAPAPMTHDITWQTERLPIEQVFADRLQVRKHFDDEALNELANSIALHGVQQPITVRPALVKGQPGYLIVAGERRYRACLQIGQTTIPAIVRHDLADASRDQLRTLQVIENLQRADLTPIETCEGVTLLVDQYGVTGAAEQLGKDKSWVSRRAGLLHLWEPAVALLSDGIISSVDIVHELARLNTLNPDSAQHMVGLFRNPPAHRSAPNREEIREAVQREMQYQQDESQAKAEQAQREVEADNAKGYESTAGEDRDATRNRALNDDEAADEALAREELAKKSDYEKRSAYRMQISEKVREQQDRLTLLLEAALGIERYEGGWNEAAEVIEPYWRLRFGRKTEDAPISVDADLPWINAAEFPELDQVVYNVNIHAGLQVSGVEQIAEMLRLGSERYVEIHTPKVSTPAALPGDIALEDLLRSWLKKHVKRAKGERIKAGWLWKQFGLEHACSISDFGKAMKALGYESHRLKTGMHYLELAPKVPA